MVYSINIFVNYQLRKFYSTKEIIMKIIFKSILSLGLVQGINLLIPLIVTPFLIKKIGVSTFGVLATAQSVIVFFTLFTDFGFNITSVRRLAMANKHKETIEGIVNGVFYLKLCLLFIAMLLYGALVFSVPLFYQHYNIYLFSFVIVIGQTFMPLWFYQGTEQIQKTILPVVILKIITVVTILKLVKNSDDAYKVNVVFGLGNLITGIFLYFLIHKKYAISIKRINFNLLKEEFKESIAIYVSNLGVYIFANTSLLILSFYLTPYLLGIYSVVDKIIQLLKAMLGLIHHVTYPRLCNLLKESTSNLKPFIKNIYGIIWTSVFVGCITLFFSSNFIVSYFIQAPNSKAIAINILKCLSFIVFITSLNMPFYQTLLAFKKDWLTVKILLLGSLLSIILNLLLIPTLSIKGTIFTVYIIESLVTISFIVAVYQLKKKKLLLFD